MQEKQSLWHFNSHSIDASSGGQYLVACYPSSKFHLSSYAPLFQTNILRWCDVLVAFHPRTTYCVALYVVWIICSPRVGQQSTSSRWPWDCLSKSTYVRVPLSFRRSVADRRGGATCFWYTVAIGHKEYATTQKWLIKQNLLTTFDATRWAGKRRQLRHHMTGKALTTRVRKLEAKVVAVVAPNILLTHIKTRNFRQLTPCNMLREISYNVCFTSLCFALDS